MRFIRFAVPAFALTGQLVAAGVPIPAKAQGWSPSPTGERGAPADHRTDDADRRGAMGQAEQGRLQQDPSPGRGRPPGILGELRSGGEPAARQAETPTLRPESRRQSGSIIPDRQVPPARTPTEARQAMPREAIPGGYRPYYDQSGPPSASEPLPSREPGPTRDRRPPERDHRSDDGERRPGAGGSIPRPGRYTGTSVGEGFGAKGREVEMQDLAPVLSADGSRLPSELWRGMSVPEVERLMGSLSIPPRSAALHDLWRRLLIAKGVGPAGGKTPSHFLALRLAALYKSGLLKDLETATGSAPEAKDTNAEGGDLVLAIQRAKAQLGLGLRNDACVSARSTEFKGEVPRPVAQDALLLSAYCAAADGNAAAASTTVDMAREQQLEAPLAFAIVDHLASGNAVAPFKPVLPKDVSLIDYRFLELVKAHEGHRLMERAEPALVAALARESKGDAQTRIEAAEDAARIHALDAETLAQTYREIALPTIPGEPPPTAKIPPALKRATLAQAIGRETSAPRKARLMQALLQEARSQTLYVPVARGLLPVLKDLRPTNEMAFFAETAVEIALAGGDYATAVNWAVFGTAQDRSGRADGLMHWMTLIDIAGAREYVPRGSGLKPAEELALKGKFAPEVLHAVGARA